MADLGALHSVGNSVVSFLERSYPQELRDQVAAGFHLLSSGQLDADPGLEPGVSLYLYRVSLNEHLRLRPSPMRPNDPPPLALDLHYLLTVWADSPLAENLLFTWTLRQLHLHPLLDASSLSADGGWGADETVQLIPAELGHEDLMRVWEAIAPTYRLSFGYIARGTLIGVPPAADARPVVARRMAVTDQVPSARRAAEDAA